MPSAPAQRILVMDDDIDTVNLLALVLKRGGYSVSSATTWDEVLQQLRNAEATHQKFDLVLLDIMMPYRSGFDVYLTLQVLLSPMPPVIFLSAKCSIDDMVKASEMGAARYLVKPTTPDKLLIAVREVLAQKVR